MDGRTGCCCGGILGLLEALEDTEFEQALEFDLITLGLRLRWLADGTDRLSYRDVIVVVRESGHDSAIGRYVLGDAHGWQASEELLAGLLDAVNGLLWQGGGGKGAKPKPIPRPSVSRDVGADSGPQSVFGEDFEQDAVSLEEIQEWLGLNEPVQPVLSPRERAVIEYNAGGITQAALGKKYGVSASTVSRWVRATNILDQSLAHDAGD